MAGRSVRGCRAYELRCARGVQVSCAAMRVMPAVGFWTGPASTHPREMGDEEKARETRQQEEGGVGLESGEQDWRGGRGGLGLGVPGWCALLYTRVITKAVVPWLPEESTATSPSQIPRACLAGVVKPETRPLTLGVYQAQP